MQDVINWLNQNPGVTLVILVIVAFWILSYMLKKAAQHNHRALERRMIEYQRSREQQSADLLSRINDDAARNGEFLQLIHEQQAQSIERLYELQHQSMQASEARLSQLSESVGNRQDTIQRTLNERLGAIQTANDQKLDQMREMVDQKLTSTLERRLGESFKRVSDQLESVHKGLGEMQALASGVGDLKRVLTGVKTRGVWGEVRLGALLEQNLVPTQYRQNAQIDPNSSERVEFAIELPGKHDELPVLLPIDAKFPQEDYQRLLDAIEQNDPTAIKREGAALERAITEEAKRIAQKYIKVPHSTDFAIMFLPSEGLYAEVLRRPGLMEGIQEKYRIVLCGPTTISALLSSLQMGFRTLAVEQRSVEIWRLLGSVKTEFAKFGDVLDKTRQRLEQATTELDNASVRTRAINRKLKAMEQLGAPDDTED